MPESRLQRTRMNYRRYWPMTGLQVGEVFTMNARYIVNPDPQCNHNWLWNIKTDSYHCLECSGEISDSEYRRCLR